jgi:ABC-2 type transport system ATP-binding protein
MPRPAILTRNLTRVFQGASPLVALDRVSLEIPEGELFGLLGPNGAGKTTLIKILCTLLLPTSGEAYVRGWDVAREPGKIREVINMVTGGEISGYGLLTVEENLWLFSQLYGVPGSVVKPRIRELLRVVGLEERARTKVNQISTGERQMMNLCRGLVTDPEVLFLDEPTLGLDVNASRRIREYIQEWIREEARRTILLTTHSMQEADELCDRVAIIDEGRVLACDTPSDLKRSLQREAVFTLEVRRTFHETEVLDTLEGVRGFHRRDDVERGVTEFRMVLEDEGAIPRIVSAMAKEGVEILSLSRREPTLEDVFIDRVGKGFTAPGEEGP